MKKYLFFDIDGTLYNSKKQLSEKTIHSIQKAKEKGSEIFIATGRAPFMIRPVLEKLQIDSYVCFNGQYVVYKNDVFHTEAISNEKLQALQLFASNRQHPIVVMNEEKMIANKENHPFIDQAISSLHFPYPEVDNAIIGQNDIYQALVFCQEGEEEEYKRSFPHLKFVRWHDYSVDVLPGGGSKANAIEALREKLGVNVEDIIAFGDGLNDVEMIKAAGIGVVMGNGHRETIAVADHVTGHVDEEGLTEAMEKLGLI
ncbi:Cof-type HAD-IIB family hydrolase [Paenisporosarcina cavernae]|uniref:Cof-type HAD-IIB family hydrolase n=1 Tax=Paenisporosarcina cavernae TaxID=2320858 RepID=A0A385YRT6_9BACL|nr:Cof-type HAD-IIB family hydrolase [Paenisporosarcina cavernae]AYC29100.1 Cof-type HAD-IIB family hydrolase [Paenisporosarcina cavernae]